jgi:[acyl-carrier-protein] S-malonyltransferase
MDVVLLFPGQGSQQPGMGRDLAAAFPAARAIFAEVDAALGVPLSTLCFEGPAEELTRTDNAQPALLAHSAAVWAVTRDLLAPRVRAAAGHSLGEFTAYYSADALSLPAAARLVRRRGTLMREAGDARPGTMAAILGSLTTPIDAICRQASEERGEVVPANFNAPDQIVVSGEVAGVERAMELAKAAGAKRAIRLPVSGAFHSPLMAGAETKLGEALASAGIRAPRFPVYANVDAQPVTGAAQAVDGLRRQLTAPVRWVDVVRALTADYPGACFIELGAGAVLTGLVKRIAPGTATATCGTPADVERLASQMAVGSA